MGFWRNLLFGLRKPQPHIRQRSIFEQLIQAERDSATWRRTESTLVEPAGSLSLHEHKENHQRNQGND